MVMNFFSRRTSVIAHDLLMVILAWVAVFVLRYNFAPGPGQWRALGFSLPLVLGVHGVIFARIGLYRGLWRFASIPDLWNIMRASALGALVVGLVLFAVNRLDGIPRFALLLYPFALTFLLGAPRLLYRMWKDHGAHVRNVSGRKRALILGAGRAGEMLAREMLRDDGYLPIGFLDDSSKLKGAKLRGVPVLGTIDKVQRVVENTAPDVLVIAMPSASNAHMQRVVELCEQTGVPLRTLPRLQDVVLERGGLRELREVAIDDLLGRDPVLLDFAAISAGLAGKTVLVTGGGGSIGSELCRQIAKLGPTRLVVLERCEFNLYTIEMELRRRHPDLVLHGHLGDVTDRSGVERLLGCYCPEIIFHAAAYKHVPLLQEQPREAVRNNVLGTRILAAAADRYGCETFVMISTDKAVNPTNIMGGSKRVAELICQAMDRYSSTSFITVRFGNVLGSAGSVVPLFQSQIAAGGPVTVTHPEISRYFMTIPEACQLIMQASVMGKGGEVFVLEMGAPVKIRFLAEQMIRLSGKVPGQDIEIVYRGLRPGEKLYEELFYEQEVLDATGHDKIMLARSSEVDGARLERLVQAMEQACLDCDDVALRILLKEVVPQMVEPEADLPLQDNVVMFNRA